MLQKALCQVQLRSDELRYLLCGPVRIFADILLICLHVSVFVCVYIRTCVCMYVHMCVRTYRFMYGGADKPLARPGRKQATATEDHDVHVSYL